MTAEKATATIARVPLTDIANTAQGEGEEVKTLYRSNIEQESPLYKPLEMSLEGQIRLADEQIKLAIERQKTGESALAWFTLRKKIGSLVRSFEKESRQESRTILEELQFLTTEQQLAIMAQRELTQLLNLRRQLVQTEIINQKKRGETMTIKQVSEKVAGIAAIIKDEIDDRQLLRSVLMRVKRFLDGDESAALPTKTEE